MPLQNQDEPLATTVGVELELNNVANVSQDIETIRSRLSREGLSGWVVKTDGSCGRSGTGVELNSPILSKVKDLSQIIRVCALLRRLGFKTNARCGLHVHIGVSRLTPDQTNRLQKFFVKWENAFYLLDPERKFGTYCKPLDHAVVAGLAAGQSWGAWNSRYYWLNGSAFRVHTTAELRIMEGTIDDSHVIGWVSFLLYVYDRVVNHGLSGSWTKDASPDAADLFECMMTAVGFDNSTLAQVAKTWATRRFQRLHRSSDLNRIRAERRSLRLKAWRGEAVYHPIFSQVEAVEAVEPTGETNLCT